MRGHKSPFRAASARETLRQNLIGNNVGNLIFAESSFRLLNTSRSTVDLRRLTDLSADAINESYDAVVIPLANAFRASFVTELRRMTSVIQRLTVPVVVLGVGAQANLGADQRPGGDIDVDVRAFVAAVLDRSASIGVRGEVTASYLAGLGFGPDVVDVIGCPSMFMRGPHLAIKKRPEGITRTSRISLNVSPYLNRIGPLSLQFAAEYPNLIYTAQDHLTLGLMLDGRYKAKSEPPAGVPVTLDHPLIRENRVRFCLDPKVWMDHLAGVDFSVGTRIHGNIVALLAGTPALVLAHDSRTLELARYHAIPHRLLRERTVAGADLVRWYAKADWAPTVSGHAARWEHFQAFLANNGLHHVYAEGEDPAAFDRELAAVEFPAPVQMGGIEDWSEIFGYRGEIAALRKQNGSLAAQLKVSKAKEFNWRELPQKVARKVRTVVRPPREGTSPNAS